jgi:hypothetical protein
MMYRKLKIEQPELASKIKHDLVLSDFVPDRDKLVCLLLSSCSKVDD